MYSTTAVLQFIVVILYRLNLLLVKVCFLWLEGSISLAIVTSSLIFCVLISLCDMLACLISYLQGIKLREGTSVFDISIYVTESRINSTFARVGSNVQYCNNLDLGFRCLFNLYARRKQRKKDNCRAFSDSFIPIQSSKGGGGGEAS